MCWALVQDVSRIVNYELISKLVLPEWVYVLGVLGWFQNHYSVLFWNEETPCNSVLCKTKVRHFSMHVENVSPLPITLSLCTSRPCICQKQVVSFSVNAYTLVCSLVPNVP
jgi:hypothetical protein